MEKIFTKFMIKLFTSFTIKLMCKTFGCNLQTCKGYVILFVKNIFEVILFFLYENIFFGYQISIVGMTKALKKARKLSHKIT